MAVFHVKLLLLMVLGVSLSAAQAAVNRCVGADGKVTFSDQPCAATQQGGAVQVKPAVGGSAAKPAPPAAGKAVPEKINTPAAEKAKADQLKSETCAHQREVLAIRRPMLPTLSANDRKALESLDQEYRQNCG